MESTWKAHGKHMEFKSEKTKWKEITKMAFNMKKMTFLSFLTIFRARSKKGKKKERKNNFFDM